MINEEMEQITIVEKDEKARAAIKALLASENLIEKCQVLAPENYSEGPLPCLWIGSDKPAAIKENDSFQKPLRIGALLDRIHKHINLSDQSVSETIGLGAYDLNTSEGNLINSDTDEAIRLTEKEVHILQFLAKSTGVVDRKDLLEEVWGYAEDIETHTLETHIYRLRQKIENDPANPELLVTEGPGYRLKI